MEGNAHVASLTFERRKAERGDYEKTFVTALNGPAAKRDEDTSKMPVCSL